MAFTQAKLAEVVPLPGLDLSTIHTWAAPLPASRKATEAPTMPAPITAALNTAPLLEEVARRDFEPVRGLLHANDEVQPRCVREVPVVVEPVAGREASAAVFSAGNARVYLRFEPRSVDGSFVFRGGFFPGVSEERDLLVRAFSNKDRLDGLYLRVVLAGEAYLDNDPVTR